MTKATIIIFLATFLLIIGILLKHHIYKNFIITKNYNDSYLKKKFIKKMILLFFIALSIALTFSNFNIGYKKLPTYANFIDTVIMIDYSTSMLANDVEPNRFFASKIIANNFIDNFQNNRFAFVLFGDDPYIEIPLTDNLEFMKRIINSIDLNDQYYSASRIISAIETCINLLERSPATYKNLIIISDFDFAENQLTSSLKKRISTELAYIYCIIISSREGSRIYLPQKGSFLKDQFQNDVFSKTNINFINDLATLPNCFINRWQDSFEKYIEIIQKNQKDQLVKLQTNDNISPRKANFFFGFLAAIFIIFYIFENIDISEILYDGLLLIRKIGSSLFHFDKKEKKL